MEAGASVMILTMDCVTCEMNEAASFQLALEYSQSVVVEEGTDRVIFEME